MKSPDSPVRALLAVGTLLLASGGWFNSRVHAQVVQLPTFRNFSYSGGALIPDAGTGYLGGASYHSQSSISRGGPWMSHRSIGSSGVTGGLSVSVTVIDLDVLDQAILSANVPPKAVQDGRSGTASTADSEAAMARSFISNYRSLSGTEKALDHRDFQRSLTSRPNRQSNGGMEGQPALAESNVRFYLKKGREAENASRIQSARIYYRMAIDALTPEMLERYQSLLSQREQEESEQSNQPNAARRPF